MFIRLILFSLLLFPLLVIAQNIPIEKINWMSWEQAIALQKNDRENYSKDQKANPPPKKLFLDIYTSWCGWCKKMDATTFKDKDIVKAMNQYYYPVKLDAEMPENITYNGHEFINPNPNPAKGRRGTHQLPASLLDYKLTYPSYVIMDENTSRLVVYKGYKKKDGMLGILNFFGTNQYLTYKSAIQQQKVASPNSVGQSKQNSNANTIKVQPNENSLKVDR